MTATDSTTPRRPVRTGRGRHVRSGRAGSRPAGCTSSASGSRSARGSISPTNVIGSPTRSSTTSTVTPRGVTLGAEIRGVDLTTELTDGEVADIRRALADYKVIYFRDQPVTSAQHVAFARRFGELEIHPFISGNEEHPELVRFEKGADTGGFENGWHHDVTWREVPSMGAILHAIQVPRDRRRHPVLRHGRGLRRPHRRVEGAHRGDARDPRLHARVRAARSPPTSRRRCGRQYPLVRHPVVRTHPVTGRKLIYVNGYFTSHIDGLDEDESREVITHLIAQAGVRRVPVPPELGARHHRVLGQRRRAALRGERLLPRHPDHGAGQRRGDPPRLERRRMGVTTDWNPVLRDEFEKPYWARPDASSSPTNGRVTTSSRHTTRCSPPSTSHRSPRSRC